MPVDSGDLISRDQSRGLAQSQPLVKFLKWDESVREIRKILGKLDDYWRPGGHEKMENKYLPLVALRIALFAQLRAIEHLNDQYFNCAVPWDSRIGLPSYPTLAADAKKFGDLSDLSKDDKLRVILDSFSSWAFLLRGSMKCSCGNWGLEAVDYEIWLNHVLGIEDNGLSIEQLVGVRSNNRRHLKHHYQIKRQSKQDPNLHIIWESKDWVKVSDEGIEVKTLKLGKDPAFDVDVFRNLILSIYKS